MPGRGLWPVVALVILVDAVAVLGQRPAGPEGQPTFRTATNLVTVDAVVLDAQGRHVTDLTKDDFEVIQSGDRQQLRQVVYVPLTGEASIPTPPPSTTGAETPEAPTRRLGPDALAARARESSRLIAIVVDDLGLSFRSTADVRRALSKFIDQQIQPNDIVAILRTGAGVGALQQFTNDKRLLYAAIDRLRWSIMSRAGISAFSPVAPPDALGNPGVGGSGTAEIDDENTIEGLRTSMLAAGSLGALEYVIRGVERLPGRKSVIFVSEGFRLQHRPAGFSMQSNDRVWNAFTRVMDRANRAGVVVYTMDARGLETGGLTAEDNPQAAPPPPGAPGAVGSLGAAAQAAVLEPAADRRQYLLDSQESLIYMAEQTGGFAVVNNNDLAAGFGRVLNDLRGYYLLGFESSGSPSDAWEAGRIRIRVKRPGLRVRARQGLFGPADPVRTTENAAGDSLVLAALSPFSTGDLDVRLTALFGHDATEGSYVRSMFFVDSEGVRFEQIAGRHVGQITLLLLTVGENGQILGQFRRTVDLDLSDEELRVVRQRGILYNARMPIKTSGGYQVRAAVRDEKSGRLGSGSQFFEAPRVGKKRVALSGIVMQGQAARAGQVAAQGAAEPALEPVDINAGIFSEPGIRIFRPGADAVYSCEIYDGITDNAITLATFATLLRDGREVYQSKAAPVTRHDKKGDIRVVPVAGRLSLGRNMPKGPYTLRITVAEEREARVVRQTSQWVEFEVR